MPATHPPPPRGTLSAVQAASPPLRAPTSQSPHAPVEDEVLLSLAAGACESGTATTNSPLQALPCPEQQASALFELASRWTTPGAEFTPPSQTALRRFAAASSDALRSDSERLHGWTLASIAALAALNEEARHALAQSSLPTQILRLVTESPPALILARSLLALGALSPSLSDAAQQAQARAQISAGLRHPDRFVWRQAVLAAALSGDDTHSAAVLQTLARMLPGPPPAATVTDPSGSSLPSIPAHLPSASVAELTPLLSVYVDVLLSSSEPAATETAERLLQAVLAADPHAATAHFLRAKLLDRRRDGSALPVLRRALGIGNLPAVFVASLGPNAAALTPTLDLIEARRRVRLLLHRPRGTSHGQQLTAAELDRVGPHQPVVPRVSGVDLEARAAAQVAATGITSPESLALGRELFRLYPFGSQKDYDPCLRSFLFPDGNNHDLLDALGLQVDRPAKGPRTVPGLVQVVDDSPQAAASPSAAPAQYGVTCALCHTQIDAHGQRRDGLPSRSHDQGLLLAACIDQPIHYKAQNRSLDQLMTYGPGRNDSSSDGVHDPTDIPSLWGLAAHGSVRWNGDTPSLELQIDRNLSSRPAPTAVIALVAAYLRSLGHAAAQAAAKASTDPALASGQHVFAQTCARCHEPPLYTSGRVIALSTVDTDAARISAVLPNSGNGYKVPTLLGILQTAPYLHDGSVPTLDTLLDPRRSGGHRFGLSLPASDRAALLRFLRRL